ncbi:hypothetical protein QUA56_34745 [Microcoleus sp. N3A4]|uniref:hypothetical protein n=1 Tax=Microcoleus sp. N3A4 TaxID=3055379 RepID=UPI002FD631C4
MVLTLIQEAVDEAKSEGRIQSDDRSQQHKSDSNEQDLFWMKKGRSHFFNSYDRPQQLLFPVTG